MDSCLACPSICEINYSFLVIECIHSKHRTPFHLRSLNALPFPPCQPRHHVQELNCRVNVREFDNFVLPGYKWHWRSCPFAATATSNRNEAVSLFHISYNGIPKHSFFSFFYATEFVTVLFLSHGISTQSFFCYNLNSRNLKFSFFTTTKLHLK